MHSIAEHGLVVRKSSDVPSFKLALSHRMNDEWSKADGTERGLVYVTSTLLASVKASHDQSPLPQVPNHVPTKPIDRPIVVLLPPPPPTHCHPHLHPHLPPRHPLAIHRGPDRDGEGSNQTWVHGIVGAALVCALGEETLKKWTPSAEITLFPPPLACPPQNLGTCVLHSLPFPSHSLFPMCSTSLSSLCRVQTCGLLGR